jgi:lactate dehydrogenase-like 2-hydroxyacid dehydrogenase
LIPDRLTVPDVEKKVFGDDYEIITTSVLNADDVDDILWNSAHAVLAWHDLTYNAELIEKLISCKVIVRVGVGYDNVDLEAAKKKNIVVCNVPDYGTNDVADHAFALLLTLVRGTEVYNRQLKRNMIWEWTTAGELHRITNLTFGIIGLGRIGTATALRAKSFGMNVVFYDPYVPDGKDKALQVTRVNLLNELLEKADIISIHTPLTDETRSMVNKDFFDNVKKNLILINTARGKIIDLDALNNALQDNVVKAAGLDVLPQEPPDINHPLIQAWQAEEDWLSGRLLITPHSAFYNRESYIEMRQKAAEEALRVLNHENPKNKLV